MPKCKGRYQSGPKKGKVKPGYRIVKGQSCPLRAKKKGK